MGGGVMIRGMTRLVGAATAGTAAMAPSSSTTVFCHASSPEHLNTTSSVLNLSQETPHGSVPSKATADAHLLNAEDLEYSFHDDWGKISYNRLIFAPAPSEEEVEEATNELHAALHLSIPASRPNVDVSECTHVPENEREMAPAVVDVERVADKPLPSLCAGLGLLAARSSSVYQAFHLLQTNAKVQDAVKSLARDPAVWKAVLSNEKVIELTQTLHEGQGTTFQKKPTVITEETEESNILNKVCDFVTGKVSQILDKVVEIVGSIFSSVEKTFFSKENTSKLDKTVVSCMMLTVAVLLMVVVKRVGK